VAVKRIWHGWTTPEKADAYERIVQEEVFPSIEAKAIPGYRSIELLRRNVGNEVEFVTIMTFASLQNVIDFQGEHYENSYVPDVAQKVLKRWDQKASHYDAITTRKYDVG